MPPFPCGSSSILVVIVRVAETVAPSETGFGATSRSAVASGKSLSLTCVEAVPAPETISIVSLLLTVAVTTEWGSHRSSSG